MPATEVNSKKLVSKFLVGDIIFSFGFHRKWIVVIHKAADAISERNNFRKKF